MEDALTRSMLYFLKLSSETLEDLIEQTKQEDNDLNDFLEHDKKIAQLKELKKLIKEIENGKY